MKTIFIYILLAIVISATIYSCTGYHASYGVGFKGAYGPYGGHGYNPRVNVGTYSGGYPRYGGY